MSVPTQMNLMLQVIMTGFAGQMRISAKGGPEIPAWTHSVRVMLTLQSYGYSREVFLGGGAHDLEEDTIITNDFIKRHFGDRVAYIMSVCSIDPALGDTPRGEDDLYVRVIKLAKCGDFDPLRVKLVDSFDNNRNIHQLDADWAPNSIELGFRWLKAAKEFIPAEAVVKDFENLLVRERSLMS